MSFSHRGMLGTFLAVVMLIIYTEAQSLQMKAYYTCLDQGNGKVKMDFRAYSTVGIVVQLRAVRDDTVLSGCIVSAAAGTSTSPYSVSDVIDLGNPTLNTCGANVTTSQPGNIRSATWTFRAYSVRNDVMGSVLLNASCQSDDLTPGNVSTVVRGNIPIFTVRPQVPSTATGDNSVITGSNLVYTGTIYPTGNDFLPQVLRDKEGYYFHSCESATNEAFTENRQLIVNASGCRVEDSTYAPVTDFEIISSQDVIPILISATGPPATVVNSMRTIYFRCGTGFCTKEFVGKCIKRCGAQPSNDGADAGEVVTTQIRVDEVQPLTLEVIDIDDLEPRKLFLAGDVVRIRVTGFPAAQGANNVLKTAGGLHVGLTELSFSENFDTPILLTLPNTGCRVTTGDTVIADEFQSEKQGNYFRVTSGDLTLPTVPQFRVFIRSTVYACTNSNDQRCIQRCNSVTPNNGMLIQQIVTSFSVISPLDPPITLRIVGGDASLTDGVAVLGSIRRFTGQVIPQNSNMLNQTKGVFLYGCSYGTSPEDTERKPFIDAQGCAVGDFLNSQCRLVSPDGEPPFVIDCGEFVTLNEGTEMHFQCTIGGCFTEGNPICSGMRCGQGPIGANSNARNLGITASGSLTLIPSGRTAEESEPLRTIIGVVSGIGAFIFVLITMIIACMILRKQKKKLQDDEDTATFAY